MDKKLIDQWAANYFDYERKKQVFTAATPDRWKKRSYEMTAYKEGIHKALSYVMERAKQDCSTNEMDPSDNEDNMLISIGELKSIIAEVLGTKEGI